MPSVGRQRAYKPPKEGPLKRGADLRIDSGVYEGGEISVHYDPMIAKLVTKAPDRSAAVEAMASALDSFHIEGIRHNIPFLSAVMDNERWRQGELSNDFIEQEFPGGFKGAVPDQRLKARLIAIAVSIYVAEFNRKRRISGKLSSQLPPLPNRLSVRFDEEWHSVEVLPDASGLWISDEAPREKHHVASAWFPGQAIWRGRIDGHAATAQTHPLPAGHLI